MQETLLPICDQNILIFRKRYSMNAMAKIYFFLVFAPGECKKSCRDVIWEPDTFVFHSNGNVSMSNQSIP